MQKLLKQEGTARIDCMQQSFATHSLYLGLQKIVHAVNPPCSAFLFQKFWHCTITIYPTADIYTCYISQVTVADSITITLS